MVRIADSLQNAHVNAFAGISFADRNVYFAEKSIAERSALPIPHSPVYVCNVCQLRRGCVCDRAYYVATQAHAVAMRRYSESRSKPQTHGDELAALDKLVTPLIKKGQPLTHIYSTHRDKIPVSERTLYRYIDAGMLGVENLDLRRKVSYRQRRKQKKKL